MRQLAATWSTLDIIKRRFLKKKFFVRFRRNLRIITRMLKKCTNILEELRLNFFEFSRTILVPHVRSDCSKTYFKLHGISRLPDVRIADV